MIKGRGGKKKNCARRFVPLDGAAMAEKESASALVSAERPAAHRCHRYLFTVTITLALAPVPFPGHDCLIDRDYATKRPVGIAVVRKITFRPDGNKYSKEAEQ